MDTKEKICINQIASEQKITYFEKSEDRNNFPLPPSSLLMSLPQPLSPHEACKVPAEARELFGG